MQDAEMGRLPSDVADDDEGAPAPQYIPEATTPSEELWARERARYRAKNEPDQRN
jgi:hypothetical protein